MHKQYIIIGASAASMGVLSRLRALNPNGRITCIAAQTMMPYNTCLLADYIAGTKTREQINTKDAAFFADNNIDLRLGTWVQSIDEARKVVVCKDAHNSYELSYDLLFLGTGTAMTPPPIAGLKDFAGVFGFHTLEHAQALDAYLREQAPQHAVVIGAGLSGIECADALVARGLQVHVVEQAERILPAFTDQRASDFLVQKMSACGVMVHTATRVQALEGEHGRVSTVLLGDGVRLSAQVVVVATGGRAQNQLASALGLAMHDGRLLVNEHLQTSDPSIYAAGDSCLLPHLVTRELIPNTLWTDAMQQGMYAAMAMAGQPKVYPGILPITSSRFFGTAIACAGDYTAQAGRLLVDESKEHYQVFCVKNNRLLGFLMVGKLAAIGELRARMLK